MPITINGSGTVTGISAGGLPDAIITQPEMATGVAGNGPAFSAYQNSAQSGIANLTFTKINLQAEEFDTANCFDSTTNYRFTPNVAGYYQITGQILPSAVSGGVSIASVYKNGTRFKDGVGVPNSSGVATETNVTALIYLNGSTDYVELYYIQSSGSNMTLSSNPPSSNFFQGALVRAA